MEAEFLNCNLCVTFSELAKSKIDIIVDICQKEVGWLGLVEQVEPGNFYVHDIKVPKQEVNSGTTEIAPDAVGKVEFELWDENKINMENQNSVGLLLWGHSHANMGVGASGQDDKQFKEYYKPKEGEAPPYYIRMISNKKGEMSLSVYIKDMVPGGIVVHRVPYNIDRPEYDELADQVKAEITDKVKEKTYVYSRNAVGNTNRASNLPAVPNNYGYRRGHVNPYLPGFDYDDGVPDFMADPLDKVTREEVGLGDSKKTAGEITRKRLIPPLKSKK